MFSRFLDARKRHGLLHAITNQVAVRLPRYSLRYVLGESGISAHEKFLRDGYNDLLLRDHSLDPQDSVMVLGGYLGDSVAMWRSLYGVRVHAVEPVPEFAAMLRTRFLHDDKVLIHELAVGAQDGEIVVVPDGDASGQFAPNGQEVRVSSRRATSLLQGLPDSPSVMEVNIEGGEYAVLLDLLDSGRLPPTLIIQFHLVDERSELLRAQLRHRLRETHSCEFNYDWVWERWDRR